MTVSSPSDEAVRAKAYQLWLAGGMIQGRDMEDWLRAKEILSQHNQTSQSTGSTPQTIAQAVVEGMLGAAQLAVNATVSAIGGMLGSASAEPKMARPEPDPPTGASDVPAAALEAAERKLQFEAERRIRDSQSEATVGAVSDADVSKTKVNPDG